MTERTQISPSAVDNILKVKCWLLATEPISYIKMKLNFILKVKFSIIRSCKEHRKQQLKIHFNLIAPSNSEITLCFNLTL